MSRNRDWMYSRFNSEGISDEYLKGVDEFLDFAFSKPGYMLGNRIKCPCSKCVNQFYEPRDNVIYHLYSRGFMKNYKEWVAHGERAVLSRSVLRDLEGGVNVESVVGEAGPSLAEETEHPYRDMVIDALGHEFQNVDADPEDIEFEEEPNPKAKEFYTLLKEGETPIWEGCKKQTKLSFVSQMLNIKSDYNLSEACYNRMMAAATSSLPEGHCVPKDYYGAKKMLKGLGLGYVKIDACINNCMLYYKETSELQSCKVCDHPRYKSEGGRRSKGIPYKVLRYLPLTPRLQRLFMSRKTAKHMTWHAKTRTGPVCHPADSEAWKDFQRAHPEFKEEDRNVYVAFCTDGFTPFGPAAKPYSCWPVMVAVYNLPPHLCMTRPFIFLSLIIPGPKSPGQNLDVFLRPLIDEMKSLWTEGVITFDAFKKQNFIMKAVVMWTISDFPAFGMLCGWSTHGR